MSEQYWTALGHRTHRTQSSQEPPTLLGASPQRGPHPEPPDGRVMSEVTQNGMLVRSLKKSSTSTYFAKIIKEM